MPMTTMSYFFSAQCTYVRLSASAQEMGCISAAYPEKMAIWRLQVSSTASTQKNFLPIFSSMNMPCWSNLSRMSELVDTGTKSGRLMTRGTWCALIERQWVMPVAQCL